jgi:glycerol uptake facilitator-like aquaporin
VAEPQTKPAPPPAVPEKPVTHVVLMSKEQEARLERAILIGAAVTGLVHRFGHMTPTLVNEAVKTAEDIQAVLATR